MFVVHLPQITSATDRVAARQSLAALLQRPADPPPPASGRQEHLEVELRTVTQQADNGVDLKVGKDQALHPSGA